MMKKILYIALALCLLLCLAACGGDSAPDKAPVDLAALYESLTEKMPEMLSMDEAMRLNMLGISDGDCHQVMTAICAEGLRSDELWLIEAADEAALEKIIGLAQARKTAKMDETSFYSPDQYAVCEDGRILSQGLYMAFIVSPEAESFEKAFEEAMK